MAEKFSVLRIWLVAAALLCGFSYFMARPLIDLEGYRVHSVPSAPGILDQPAPRPPAQIHFDRKNTEQLALFLANFGGEAVVSLGTERLLPGEYPRQIRVDRYRGQAVFDIPPSAGEDPQARGTISIQLTNDRLPSGFGSLYVGPRSLITQEVSALRARQYAINMAMPVAVLLCLLTSIALIFFSDHPARYAYLIGAFLCSIFIELDSQLYLMSIPLRNFESYLGALLVAFSTLNLREWWGRPEFEAKAIWVVTLSSILTLALVDYAFGFGSDKTSLFRKVLFLASLAGLAFYWLFLISRKTTFLDPKIKLIAGFCSAIVAALLINLIRLYIPTGADVAFALSSAAKMLGAVSIFGLSTSALFHEIQQYSTRRREMGTMQRITSGANLNIDSEARQLKSEIERRTLLEERQRLVRDMHDGIGGQLLSVLVKLRRDDAPREELAQDVQATIAELRLLTAAMDSQMPGLGGALDDLRGRLAGQLDAAGIILQWSVAADVDSRAIDNLQIVEILRIVQEAITNVIRHAAATTVTLRASGGKILELKIADDGCGFDQTQVATGAGLRNMKRRAEKIGGSFAFESRSERGTTLVLRLPDHS